MSARQTTHCWALPPDFGPDELQGLIPPSLELCQGKAEVGTWQLIDDFDWTLWANHTVLLLAPGHAWLWQRDQPPIAAALAPALVLPLRTNALPDTPLRAAVLEHTRRNLMPRVGLVCRRQDLVVRSSTGKGIGRGWQADWRSSGGALLVRGLCLFALRGYQDEFSPIPVALAGSALRPLSSVPLFAALDAGVQGTFCPDVPDLQMSLRDSGSAWTSIRDLLGELLANTWRNETGVLADLDPECLHHYRVNLRRARALVAQTKDVIGSRTARCLTAHLRGIAQRTGALRDLDVQLAMRSWYESLLPGNRACHLGAFLGTIERRRTQAQRSLQRYLRSQTHCRRRERLAALLGGADAPASSLAIRDLLGACVLRQSRRLAKHSRRLGSQPTDVELHRLRIEAKKLRYPFEFARGIFPKDLTADCVHGLKHLQDALGAAHDLVICRGWVAGYAASDAPREPEEIAALESLAEALREQLAMARKASSRQLRAFVQRHSQGSLRALLGKGMGTA